ncbi:xylulokinase [Nocardioides halotolerans]|uniref:xylulokinase n=1 Tax=Nocardioides halotolerans TaxID=433660 RepID=UPI00040F9584|nr:xylulokinase [Nocardioides halotolerans]
MTLVAGIDSSTQSCTVVVVDAEDGSVVRRGRAAHPPGTEVDPQAWESALDEAAAAAGGLADVAALAVGAQQHGYVSLDEGGDVVRPALLWNDNRSAPQAAALISELGGPDAWAQSVGSVPVASFTATKARWVADHEPDHARRTAAVCLPHDWLTWRLLGATGLDALTTDRGDASGTAWFDARADAYRDDLVELALGHRPVLPRVLGPTETAGEARRLAPGAVLAAGTGDNMAAALGLQAEVGDVVLSIGTSGVACAVATEQTTDATGTIAGFADATGGFLPLVATLNAARVLDAGSRLLGVDHAAFSDLALTAPPGCDGLVLVPYLEGERTPALPDATGSLLGLTLATMTPGHLARACVEGVLCGLADALDALRDTGMRIERVIMVGGGAQSGAVRSIAPQVFGTDVLVPPAVEAVAMGAARQAAWALAGTPEPPAWPVPGVDRYAGDPVAAVRERYAEARQHVLTRGR